MYANYQIYECLVKFDVFFSAGFSVQFIWLVLRTTDWEYYVTCAALPLSLVLLVEGHLAAKHENKLMMATFMSGCVSAMVYFVYKVRSSRPHELVPTFLQFVKVLVLKNTDESQYGPIWKSLTVFCKFAVVSHQDHGWLIGRAAVLTIILLFATFVFSIIVLRNFGRGLKEPCEST